MSQQAATDLEAASDPRMKGFRSRACVAELSRWIVDAIKPLASEVVSLHQASGRVLASDVIATVAVPPFDRAAMDGYAIIAEETFGASNYMPSAFRCIGRSRPGWPCERPVAVGEAVEVATGAPMPHGADAVIPVEATRRDGDLVFVADGVPRGRHVSFQGEDIRAGTTILSAGRMLRPQDLGLLSSIAAATVSVVRRPAVAVVITGDEILPPATPAADFKIADANSVMLAALVTRDGGHCRVIGPLPDCRATIRDTIASAAGSADLVLVSGGSSAGRDDHVPGIIAELGRLIAHGIALRPASPTGVGIILGRDVPVVMLPGNPVSCLCGYDFIAGPIVRRLGGRTTQWPYRSVTLPLSRKLTSVIGRVDYARVRIRSERVEPLAISGASILSSATIADGFVVVPAGLEGYPAEALVTVWLYDDPAATDNDATDSDHSPGAQHYSTRSAHQTPAG